jgi:hypothetical protein
MSRTTQISTRRLLVAAGILSTVSLVAPAASHAQTGDGERALLNHIPAPVATNAAYALRIATDYSSAQEVVDGERALSVRVASGPVELGGFDLVLEPALGGAPIMGARALLRQ